jgi:hypothetical protein
VQRRDLFLVAEKSLRRLKPDTKTFVEHGVIPGDVLVLETLFVEDKEKQGEEQPSAEAPVSSKEAEPVEEGKEEKKPEGESAQVESKEDEKAAAEN